jgi:hypothetical protein
MRERRWRAFSTACYTDFWTLPLRKQRVQTLMRLVWPSISARTGWRLGLKIRLVLLLA